MPELLTPQEIAKVLKVSYDTVMRRFATYPGVVNLGTEGSISRRRYRTLRIPRAVFEKFLIENRITA
jgi:hypothetical protein